MTKRSWKYAVLAVVCMALGGLTYASWHAFQSQQPDAYYTGGVAPSATVLVGATQFAIVQHQSIAVEWPEDMDSQGSDYVTISLLPPTWVAIPMEPRRQRTLILATPLPIGTPDVPLDRAFGPDSQVSLTAQLAAVALDKESSTQPEQQLPQPGVTWDWSFQAKQYGWHVATASVFAQTRTRSNGLSKRYLLWNGSLYINTTVSAADRFFGFLQLSVGAVAGGLITLLITIITVLRSKAAAEAHASTPASGGTAHQAGQPAAPAP